MDSVMVETAGWIRGESDVETVSVTLSYDPADPFAVHVSLIGEDSVDAWTFGRDLLADGLRSMVPLGEGRVQVQATSVLTEVTYEGFDGAITTLRLPWWNTREFVRLTQIEVPRGEESYDFDGSVDDLFGPPGAYSGS